ncbi:unnamed protein product [Strongylus vulgaris]|uniref:Uncharacterized protein n=1 Tax=Strongylus vulgaris TaxID=40348 RepID=A0A3P7IGE6_STRVU|nr:unnamed protein product [Strongylus vulgaris]
MDVLAAHGLWKDLCIKVVPYGNAMHGRMKKGREENK